MHAYDRRYHSLVRHATHWHQADEVARVCAPGGSVLEVGPGSGHTTWMLRHWGYAVTTLDIEDRTRPDVVGSVTDIPLPADSFDVALAAEVLEHLPFDQFGPALREMSRVARSVVISLPAPFMGLSALVNLIGLRSLYLGLPRYTRHRFDGDHHWELGKRGTSVWTVRRAIREAGLSIIREFRPAPSRYCYFFSVTRYASVNTPLA